MKKHLLIFLAGLLLILLTGCKLTDENFAAFDSAPAPASVPATTGGPALTKVALPEGINPAWLQPSVDLFTLGPGDKVEIEIVGETNSISTTVVGPDGKIYFNLLPGLDVWGLTLTDTKALLERELSKYIREAPQVSLTLRGVESKRVWLLGRLQSPGVYNLGGPVTLLEALALAGGTTSLSSSKDFNVASSGDDLADLRRSFVIRQGHFLPIDFDRLVNHGDLSQNVYLMPDDFIYLPPAIAKEVYVIGAVVQPKPVPYVEQMTSAAAIAGAYGTIKDAYLTHVAVVRGSLTQPEIAIVDYKAVVRGHAPDVSLQPGDIVYVPFAPYRYLTRYVELVLNTFVSSAAINAGTSWTVKQPTLGAGVFIPVGSRVQVIPPIIAR